MWVEPHEETDKQSDDNSNNGSRGSRLGKDRRTENVACEIRQTTRFIFYRAPGIVFFFIISSLILICYIELLLYPKAVPTKMRNVALQGKGDAPQVCSFSSFGSFVC